MFSRKRPEDFSPRPDVDSSSVHRVHRSRPFDPWPCGERSIIHASIAGQTADQTERDFNSDILTHLLCSVHERSSLGYPEWTAYMQMSIWRARPGPATRPPGYTARPGTNGRTRPAVGLCASSGEFYWLVKHFKRRWSSTGQVYWSSLVDQWMRVTAERQCGRWTDILDAVLTAPCFSAYIIRTNRTDVSVRVYTNIIRITSMSQCKSHCTDLSVQFSPKNEHWTFW